MGRRKGTPARSTLIRASTLAFSRRKRGADDETLDADESEQAEQSKRSTEPTVTEGRPLEDAANLETQPIASVRPDPKDLPEIEPPAPGTEPWPDATPPPMRPVAPAEPVRPRTETVGVPVVHDFGRPPEMPKMTAPPPLVLGDVENPAHMPGPREIPGGSPDDPAPSPGSVPPGDSRSLRREDDFALIYRISTSVITRTGRIGTRGQWRVVEYPTSSAASSSYAKECSRFVSDGFSDYRG